MVTQPLCSHPQSKKVFPDVQRQHLLSFSLCSWPLVLSLGPTEEFDYFVASLQVFIYINWILTKAFLQTKQYQSSQSFLPGQKESGPFILFVPLW